ncbi:MAG: C25 family cysteine peptidase [bacterium]|nr:C25 family cysteine peptidase [bacterium]
MLSFFLIFLSYIPQKPTELLYSVHHDSLKYHSEMVQNAIGQPQWLPLQKSIVKIHPYFVTEFPSKYGERVDYIIITTDGLIESFEPLCAWKTEKGVNCVIRTVEWISANYSGCDIPDKIRNFLKDAYSEWGTKWVLLGGDVTEVPIRYVRSRNYYEGWYDIPTDMYYSCLNGNWNADMDGVWGEVSDGVDLTSNLCIGRFPGYTPLDIEIVVNKTLKYEIEPDTGYLNKLLLAGADLHNSQPPGDDGAQHCREIASSFPDYFKKDSLYQLYGTLSSKALLDSLEKGYGFVYIAAHGIVWQSIQLAGTKLTMSDIDNLSSPFFFITVVSCYVHWIDWNCLSRHFMLNPCGGAIGYLGATRVGWDYQELEFNRYFYQSLFTDSIFSFGELLADAKSKFYEAHYQGVNNSDNNYRDILFDYLLFGDPELKFCTNNPASLIVSFPPVVNVGEGEIEINIKDSFNNPVDRALVCVSKKSEVYARGFSNAAGEIVFGLIPESAGSLSVVVTKSNFLPYKGYIVVNPSKPFVRYKSKSIAGDGVADAGELITLSLTLENTGSGEAKSVCANLVPSSLGLSLLDTLVWYGNIPSGESKTKDYRIQIDTMFLSNAVDFSIFSYYSSDSSIDTFNLEIRSPKLLHYSHSTDKDGLYPGDSLNLSFRLNNFGNGAAKCVYAKLRSLNTELTVIDSIERINVIEAAASVFCPNCFKVLVNNPIENPQFVLELNDTLRREWVDTFSLRFPPPPDSLFTFPHPHGITVGWRALSNVRGYNVYRAPDSLLLNSYLITDNPVYEDKALGAYELRSYWVTTVDSDCNESNFSPFVLGKSNPMLKAGWPKTVPSTFFYASPVVGDFVPDYPGLEIVAATDDGKIYAWHADGTSVLPNGTGLFAELPGGIWSTPAMGDIDGDGMLDIACVPWCDNESLYVFGADGTSLTGFPVMIDGGSGTIMSITLQDLDKDDRLEIIFLDLNGKVYIFNSNGGGFLNSDGFFAQADPYIFSSPSVADINVDGELEILVGGRGKVYAWNTIGDPLPGWPVYSASVSTEFSTSPAIGDVDINYPGLEVVIAASDDSVYVFHSDGSRGTGWPQPITGFTRASPSLGNLDSDIELEIAIKENNRYYMWNHDGTLCPGFPIIQPQLDETTPEGPSLTIGDIDGDNEVELIAGGFTGHLYAIESDGSYTLGFPLSCGGTIYPVPTIADIDLDGLNELITGNSIGEMHVWSVLGSRLEWECTEHDRWHTGLYGFIPPDTVYGIETELVCVPHSFKLFQNSPNPFRQKTVIRYSCLPSGTVLNENRNDYTISDLRLTIYDLSGRLVRTFSINQSTNQLINSVVWDGRDNQNKKVSSGVYFYRLEVGDYRLTKKLILLK